MKNLLLQSDPRLCSVVRGGFETDKRTLEGNEPRIRTDTQSTHFCFALTNTRVDQFVLVTHQNVCLLLLP